MINSCIITKCKWTEITRLKADSSLNGLKKKKKKPAICCLRRLISPKDTQRLKVKGWKRTVHINPVLHEFNEVILTDLA